jgi:prolyl 4-hydroxylase
MFERIVSDPNITNSYKLTTLSRPFDDNNSRIGKIDDGILNGPWVILIDGFINSTEADRLIDLGSNAGYSRSTDLGKIKEDGEYSSKVSERRTSTNAWCNTEECIEDPIAKMVYNRIESITGIPIVNSEAFQLLRYGKGQFYLEHHDYIKEDYDRVQGVRILTVYLYLNNVQDGGGTNFPRLNVTVHPLQGRALIWPSVYNDRPHIKDPRTQHQALPVRGENDIKYGANVWIHQREIIESCM